MTPGLLSIIIGVGSGALLADIIRSRGFRARRRLTRARSDGPLLDLSDPGDQLKAVEAAVLRPKKPVNREAATVLRQLEHLVKTRAAHHYRVFAEVSLGAFLTTEGADGRMRAGWLAWMAINSKRVDFLIIDTFGHPATAVEYHGSGHHRDGGRAAARDAVKRRALEKAGIELVEIQGATTHGRPNGWWSMLWSATRSVPASVRRRLQRRNRRIWPWRVISGVNGRAADEVRVRRATGLACSGHAAMPTRENARALRRLWKRCA